MDHVQPTAPYWFAVLPTLLLAFGVLAWLAWNRWLSHKETMRAAELGGNSGAALALRERWRARHGVLWAVKVLALGVALVIVGVFADKWETHEVRRVREYPPHGVVDAERAGGEEGMGVEGAGAEEGMGAERAAGGEGEDAEAGRERWHLERRRVWRPLEPEQMLVLIGAAACLLLVGAVTLIAYLIWSRRDVEVLALGLLGDERKIAPDAGEDGEERSGDGEETEGETRG